MKRWSIAFLFAGVAVLGGCARWNISRFDAQIRHAGRAIAAATNNSQKATAYTDRADAYTEKARYSRLMKLIPDDEYAKLFDLALQDYSQAITLDPENAQIYFRRGDAYYGRAGLDMIYVQDASPFLAPAKADFSRVVAKDPKNVRALDMLGLTEGSMGDWTAAIADFGRESALNSRMRFRVSDAYCNRGSRYPKDKHDLAISDLKQAMQSRDASDPCDCEPYNPLVAIYLNQAHDYGKAREVVAQAQRSGKWIDPEYLKQLKAASANP
jgi:tetratricopeptide (TPR) repeat protein